MGPERLSYQWSAAEQVAERYWVQGRGWKVLSQVILGVFVGFSWRKCGEYRSVMTRRLGRIA